MISKLEQEKHDKKILRPVYFREDAPNKDLNNTIPGVQERRQVVAQARENAKKIRRG